MYLLRVHADRAEYELVRCADLRLEALQVLALEHERLLQTGLDAEFAPGLPVAAVERAWNEAAARWDASGGAVTDGRDGGTFLQACRGGGRGLDSPEPSTRRTNWRVTFRMPGVAAALGTRRARQCLVCRCSHLESYARYDQVDGPPVSFCGRRCYRLFEPYIDEIEDAGGLHDEPFMRIRYAAMEAVFEEALHQARRELRVVRVFRGVARAVRVLLWLGRRARARRVVQSAVVHHLYRPGGRAQRRPLAQWQAAVGASRAKRQRLADRDGALIGRLRGGGRGLDADLPHRLDHTDHVGSCSHCGGPEGHCIACGVCSCLWCQPRGCTGGVSLPASPSTEASCSSDASPLAPPIDGRRLPPRRRSPCARLRPVAAADLSADAPWGLLLSPRTTFTDLLLDLRSVLRLRATCSAAASQLPIASLLQHFGLQPETFMCRWRHGEGGMAAAHLRAQLALHRLLLRLGRLTNGRCSIAGSYSLARHLEATAPQDALVHPSCWNDRWGDVDIFFDTTAVSRKAAPWVMRAARRSVVTALRSAHGLPNGRVRLRKHRDGYADPAVAAADDGPPDTALAALCLSLAGDGASSAGRRAYKVDDSKTLYLDESDCNAHDYRAPLPFAVNLVEVSWLGEPPPQRAFAESVIAGFDMHQCAVAHVLTDDFRLREVITPEAVAAIRAREIVPAAHAFASAGELSAAQMVMQLRKLFERVVKYRHRGFAYPIAWQQRLVRKQWRPAEAGSCGRLRALMRYLRRRMYKEWPHGATRAAALPEQPSAHGGTCSANDALGGAFSSTCVEAPMRLQALRGGGRRSLDAGQGAPPSTLGKLRSAAKAKEKADARRVKKTAAERTRRKDPQVRADEEAARRTRRKDPQVRANERAADVRRKTAAFAAERARRERVAAHDLLYQLHAASATRITANSRRLRTLRRRWKTEATVESCAAYERARVDTRGDIAQFAHVTREDHATAVRGFQTAIEQAFKSASNICAGCGVRDIDDPMHGPIKLSQVDGEHWPWLIVPPVSVDRLDAMNDIRLLYRADDGFIKERPVRRSDLLNLFRLGAGPTQRCFHVVPEAVANGDDEKEACIYLCSRCHPYRSRPAPAAAGGVDEAPSSAPPANEFPPHDLYHTHAPPNAIGGGHDYGRLSELRALGISIDTSSLERLVLAKARCHLVAIKVRRPLPVGRQLALTWCRRRSFTGGVDDARQGAHASTSARPFDRYRGPPTAGRCR